MSNNNTDYENAICIVQQLVVRHLPYSHIYDDDDDLLSPDLNRDLSRKAGLRGHPRPGVDSCP